MSKPMILVKPASAAVSTAPTTPPAGPDRIASLPLNRSAEVSPPEDCMNSSFGPPTAEEVRSVDRAGIDGLALNPTRVKRSDPPLAGRGKQRRSHAVDVTAEQRREISIDHGGVAAPDELDQRANLVARRHLGETCEPRRLCRGNLVLGIGVSMHEDDGDRGYALATCFPKRGDQRGDVERRLDRAVGAHPLRHLDHARIQHRRLLDPPGEDLGPRLVADLERVAKSLADDEQHRIALALEQRVGRDRGAHLDAGDRGHGSLAPRGTPSTSAMPAIAASS